MLNAFDRALRYFRRNSDDPWHWAESGRVLVWVDGSTIAFREELLQVLEELAPKGLPPFPVIVLILAACRGKFPPASALPFKPRRLQRAGSPSDPEQRPWNDPANQDFSELLARLRALHELPAALKETPHAKAVLIETLFDRLAYRGSEPGLDILNVVRNLTPNFNADFPEPDAGSGLAAMRLLHEALRDFSAAQLELRLRTSLEELPEPARLELKPALRARHWLGQLQQDPEHQGLARVARDIMAALSLPRALSELDELAIGGFSDISNRGSLDRLLSSELANDDLTLATRIALNEALYIRREPPSHHAPTRLALLIDVGLRQWGLPRVFAAAASLAFIARSEHCSHASLWRARRNQIEPAELFTRPGLLDHLSVLDTYAQPGSAFKAFFETCAGQPDLEAVLIINRDSLADPDFQSHLARFPWGSLHIAAVDRDGTFELYAHPHLQKPLCRAHINLAQLFPRASAKTTALADPAANPNLPLIFSARPFPFLLPIVGQIEKMVPLAYRGGAAVMMDRRLLRWALPVLGARVLIDALPPGQTVWLGLTDEGKRVHVLKYLNKNGSFSITTWDEATSETTCSDTFIWRDPPALAYERDQILFVIASSHIHAFDLHAGTYLNTIVPPPGCRSRHGRYFARENGDWSCLAYDGRGLRFDPVPIAKLGASKTIALFDRPGQEELPCALTHRGEIFSGDGKLLVNLNLFVSRFELSRDGRRLLIFGPAVKTAHIVDLANGNVAKLLPSHAKGMLNPAPAIPTRNVRTKFTEIHCSPSTPLRLKSNRDAWFTLSFAGQTLRFDPTPNIHTAGAKKFESFRLSPNFGFKLKLASWPDGSRAWLDSRGLLHLKSGDPTQPEISFVLAEGPLAAWCSDGRICGSEFFLGTGFASPPAELIGLIMRFGPGP